MSMEYQDWFTGEYSNCCDAQIHVTGICSACKEHCEPLKEEKELLSDGELLDKIYDWMVRETGNHTLEHKGRKLLAREILGFLKDNEEEKSNE